MPSGQGGFWMCWGSFYLSRKWRVRLGAQQELLA